MLCKYKRYLELYYENQNFRQKQNQATTENIKMMLHNEDSDMNTDRKVRIIKIHNKSEGQDQEKKPFFNLKFMEIVMIG